MIRAVDFRFVDSITLFSHSVPPHFWWYKIWPKNLLFELQLRSFGVGATASQTMCIQHPLQTPALKPW